MQYPETSLQREARKIKLRSWVRAVTGGKHPEEVLGVPQDASQDTIEKAYRDKIMECYLDNPDQPINHADRKARVLSSAYRALTGRVRYR